MTPAWLISTVNANAVRKYIFSPLFCWKVSVEARMCSWTNRPGEGWMLRTKRAQAAWASREF